MSELSFHVRSMLTMGGFLDKACQPTRFETAPTNVGRFFPSIAILCQGHQKVGFDNYNHNWLYITQFMQFFVTHERCFLFTY